MTAGAAITAGQQVESNATGQPDPARRRRLERHRRLDRRQRRDRLRPLS
jgi:hypothetical protein